MDHGVARPDHQDTLRFYESPDLRHWTYLASTNPDPRWHVPTARWDHMYIIPKEKGRPPAGFWGYPVAIVRPELPRGVGMSQSPDGRSCKTLPPAPVEWGDIPQNDFEWGGCERIGGRYYLIGGTGPCLANAGCSMFVFTADSPRGPFRPDAEAYRLCGSSGVPPSSCSTPGRSIDSGSPGWRRRSTSRSESCWRVPSSHERSSPGTCPPPPASRSPRAGRRREFCCSAWERSGNMRRMSAGSRRPTVRPSPFRAGVAAGRARAVHGRRGETRNIA